MTAEARQHNPIDISKQRMLSTQNPTQEEGSQAEGHTQTLNLDYWIITCKEYKPGRRKRSNKQNRGTIREKKLSHLGADKGTKPGSDKPQAKMVRPIYMSLLSRRILMHKLIYQGLRWSKAKNGEITVMGEWISYKRDQTIYSYTSSMSYGEYKSMFCLCNKGRY
jgi:hypothetical protein